jgi:nicotinamide-nucleotide amidase
MAVTSEIITIGDELLIGQIVNTNSSWIAERLNEAGITVAKMTTIGDDRDAILLAFERAWNSVSIVIVTGGLGPTHDDISKACVAEFFRRELVLDVEVLSQVEARFRKFGYSKMPDVNRGQAMVPRDFVALPNGRGTAPGLYFTEKKKAFAILPGVPFEMQGLMTESVLPRLREQYHDELDIIRHRTILTTGIGESTLAEKLGDPAAFLPTGVTLAFLPANGSVRLRISARGHNEADVVRDIDKVDHHIRERASKYIYGEGDETLEASIVAMLAARHETLSTAESCTGGMIAARITNVAGSSAVFMGAVVAYDNSVKHELLNVPESILDVYGAVSEETARAMAEGARALLGTNHAIAITGIAGPGGGTQEKPVGTVWIAIASTDETTARIFHFGDDRERNRERATVAALEMLRQQLLR